MSARVILIAIQGVLKGCTYAFTGKSRCLIGRSHDCDLRLPRTDYTVSRHHCLLDIDAPAVAVQDLGSLNGTYVNESLIGRRVKELEPEEAYLFVQPKFTLTEGDELRVGDLAFRVHVDEDEGDPEKTDTNCLLCC